VLYRALTPDPRLRPRGRVTCSGHLACDLNGLRLPEFSAGCRLGVAVLAVAIVVSLVCRKRRHRDPLPIGGLLIAGAFVEAMRETGRLVPGLAVGLAMLAVAGVIADVSGHRAFVLAALAVPGGWILATHAGLGNVSWVKAVVAGSIIVAAPLAASLDTRAGPDGLGPVLLAVSTIGVYFTIPDTDVGLALFPIAALLALAAWPRPLVRLGAGGTAAAVGTLVWVSAVGGLGRSTAVIGGVACLGLLIAEPLGRLMAARPRGALGGDGHGTWYVVLIALVQLIVVYVASRVAGVRTQVGAAVTIATLDLGLVAIGTAVIAARRSRTTSDGDDGASAVEDGGAARVRGDRPRERPESHPF